MTARNFYRFAIFACMLVSLAALSGCAAEEEESASANFPPPPPPPAAQPETQDDPSQHVDDGDQGTDEQAQPGPAAPAQYDGKVPVEDAPPVADGTSAPPVSAPAPANVQPIVIAQIVYPAPPPLHYHWVWNAWWERYELAPDYVLYAGYYWDPLYFGWYPYGYYPWRGRLWVLPFGFVFAHGFFWNAAHFHQAGGSFHPTGGFVRTAPTFRAGVASRVLSAPGVRVSAAATLGTRSPATARTLGTPARNLAAINQADALHKKASSTPVARPAAPAFTSRPAVVFHGGGGGGKKR